MDYVFEISLADTSRRIRADYVADPTHITAYDFEPISLSETDLHAQNFAGLLTSRLDTLVLLFTGVDPAKHLLDKAQECSHDSDDTCDCTTAPIEVPAVLAYHAQTLAQSLASLQSGFRHWTNDKGDSIRKFLRPAGPFVLAVRHKDNPRNISNEWREYDLYLNRSREEILNRWYEQGIQLHQALQIQRGTATPPASSPTSSPASSPE